MYVLCSVKVKKHAYIIHDIRYINTIKLIVPILHVSLAQCIMINYDDISIYCCTSNTKVIICDLPQLM